MEYYDPYKESSDDEEAYAPPKPHPTGTSAAAPPKPLRTAAPAPPAAPAFVAIAAFGWEQGGETSPWVRVHVTLEGVEAATKVECSFGGDSFDLRVFGLRGANHRLRRGALDEDILPEKSSHVVKAGRVTVKLHKVPFPPVKGGATEKGKPRYPLWVSLSCTGGDREKDERRAPRHDGSAPYDICRALYESGDPRVRAKVGAAVVRNQERVFRDGCDNPLEKVLERAKRLEEKDPDAFREGGLRTATVGDILGGDPNFGVKRERGA